MLGDAEAFRDCLLALRERREQAEEDRERLAGDIREMLALCRGTISMSEVARLLGLDRAGLYRTYA